MTESTHHKFIWNETPDRSTPQISSRGALRNLPLFELTQPQIHLAKNCLSPLLSRLIHGRFFDRDGEQKLIEILKKHTKPANTAEEPLAEGMSAGKNTYTYDAHTYHTKVPPQGIIELLAHYLPDGGLVLDPFAGSGMTGVAAQVLGYDCVLNELSPAACFIAHCFTTVINSDRFHSGVNAILEELNGLRYALYTTTCRECGKPTELLYTVWSYQVICPCCQHEFVLWDQARSYGRVVREHKILSEFPCPACGRMLKKSRLPRTQIQPVQVGYKCCGSSQQEMMHPPNEFDRQLIEQLTREPLVADGFYPTIHLPDGINLRQPINHGLDRIDKFYTPRNLAAMSHLWKTIHRVDSLELATFLAFAFTSLYQRVTRLSEFRFWGGSGNTARFNVPYIFNEPNVFLTFARKARSIQDHLQTTAQLYHGQSLVVQNSATALDYLPDESVDLIFTDPPFGANINYSEMNILWEAWLGSFTDNEEEAIISKVQEKGVIEYQQLMTKSLQECHRVLRTGHWLLLVFMNSSQAVWGALRNALADAGFKVVRIDLFDKQHGTFKQFVSENTTGYDLILHCQKAEIQDPLTITQTNVPVQSTVRAAVLQFLEEQEIDLFTTKYLHVQRADEIDFRKLYSAWLTQALLSYRDLLDFADFRVMAIDYFNHRDVANSNGAT